MDDQTRTTLAKTFESGAAAYERVRPGFPDARFDDVVARAGSRLQRGILEVGAGTGRATLPLAQRGFRVEVIEPSADMVSVLTDQLRNHQLDEHVTVRNYGFEEVPETAGPYGAVIAAQSFHWADPATRWTRLAKLLGADGLAFLFWNGWVLDPGRHDLERVAELYQRSGLGLVPDLEDYITESTWAQDEIAGHPQLEDAVETTYAWDWSMPVDDYLALLSTKSQYAAAAPGPRQLLLAELGTILGDTVSLQGRTLLLTTAAAHPVTS